MAKINEQIVTEFVLVSEDREFLQGLAGLVKRRIAAVGRDELQVGDWVQFEHNGSTYYGRIVRTNPKTVTLEDCIQQDARGRVHPSRGWRVSYAHAQRVDSSNVPEIGIGGAP